MLTLRQNITSVIESTFAESKEELQEMAVNRIMELIDTAWTICGDVGDVWEYRGGRWHNIGASKPQTDKGIGCSRCEGRYDCCDRDMPHAAHCNNYGKITDEPQQLDCRNKEYYSSCEYVNRCHPMVCFKAVDELNERLKEKSQTDCRQTDCPWK